MPKRPGHLGNPGFLLALYGAAAVGNDYASSPRLTWPGLVDVSVAFLEEPTMFEFKVLKLFRETFGPWVTAAPPRPKPRPTVIPRLEALEDRLAPANVSLFWDPSNGKNASTAANWDTSRLGGMKATAAPGMTAGETDSIYFDGTVGTRNNNSNCTWDYTPTNTLGAVIFQNGYNHTVSFADKEGFSVSQFSYVADNTTPYIAPNGNSGASAVAAITLTNGAHFTVSSESSLNLEGYSSGNAVFFAGDKTAGEYLLNAGNVYYVGVGALTTDYLKIPVANEGTFKVDGKGSTGSGSTLQVSGSDATNTGGVSFYQDESPDATQIAGGGTLWCYNDFKMTAGGLATMDGYTDILQVGTSSVDGTVNLTGGNVSIFYSGTTTFGTLQISGTTQGNKPTLDVGTVTLNFAVDTTMGSNACNKLIVGKSSGTGKVNFGNNGGTTTVAIIPQGNGPTGHKWQVIFFGSRTGDVTLSPANGYTKNWSNPNYLEIDN
jgi:hypothetical protein